MRDLTTLTTEELQAELDRRNQPKALVPQSVENPDWTAVTDMCKSYIAEVERKDVDEDLRHYIFEAAVEAVYGKDVWEWVNARL